MLSHVQLFVTPWISLPGSSVRGIFQGRTLGVGCHFLLQVIFLTQGLNPHLLSSRWILKPPGLATSFFFFSLSLQILPREKEQESASHGRFTASTCILNNSLFHFKKHDNALGSLVAELTPPPSTPTKGVGRQDSAMSLGCLLLRKVVFQNGTHSAPFGSENVWRLLSRGSPGIFMEGGELGRWWKGGLTMRMLNSTVD